MIRYKLQAVYLGLKLVDEGRIKGCIGERFSWEACHKENYIDVNSFAHTRDQLQLMERKWGYNFDGKIHRLVD